MASSTGPVKAFADKADMISTNAATSGVVTPNASVQRSLKDVAARGRSTSPGQYTSLSARGARGQSHGQTSSTITAWAESTTGTLASPRTPRHGILAGNGAPDLRLGVAVVEIQRQAENERRNMNRQIQQLERKFQDQVSAPAVGRERWADLQGSVSGMMEEMSALAKRVESLDEKLRLRIGGSEELTRTRTRELEQQIHAYEHKAHLANSTHEEIQKRQAAKMRKVTQTVEEHARRLEAVEGLGRRGDGHEGSILSRLEARLLEMEQRQFSVEEEVRSFFTSGMPGAHSSGATALLTYEGAESGKEVSSRDDDDAVIRQLEREFSSLAERTASQLDEHSAALANLRVRTDGQEKRLVAAAERLETVVSPPLEALRLEVQQGREHDRQELESRLDVISRRVQELSDASDETIVESAGDRREMRDIHELEQLPIIKKLSEASSMHQQALRQLESLAQQSTPEEICGLHMRADSLEQRVVFLEKDTDGHGLDDKADRTELLRVEAALRELSDPLRRLSQRAAAAEGKTTALERRVEHLQQLASQERPVNSEGGASSTLSAQSASEDVAAALMRVDVISSEVAELRARIIDVESLTESGVGAPSTSGRKIQSESIAKSSSQACHENDDILEQVAELRERIQELSSRESSSPVSRHTDQLDQALNRRISSLEKGLAESKDQAKSKELYIDERLKEGFSDLKSRFDDMRPSTSSSVQQCSIDKEVLERFEKQQLNLEQLGSSFEACDHRLNELSARNSEFNKRWEEQFKVVERDVGVHAEAMSGFQETLEINRTTAKTTEAELGKLRNEQEALETTLSELADGVKVAQSNWDKLLNEHSGRLDELDKISAVDENSKTLKAEMVTLREDVERIKKVEENIKTLKAEIGTFQENAEHIKKVDENNKSLKAEIDTFREDVEHIKKVDENIDTLKAEMSTLRENVSSQLKGVQEKGTDDKAFSMDGIVDALQRISSSEEASASLHESLEALRSKVEKTIEQVSEDSDKQTKRNDDLFGRLESMEERLGKVGSGSNAVVEGDIGKRVAEALSLTEKNEEELGRLQSLMEDSVKALDAKLQTLSIVENGAEKDRGSAPNESKLQEVESKLSERLERQEERAMKGVEDIARLQKDVEASQTTLKELGLQVQKAVEVVEASEAATAAVREELMCAPPIRSQEMASANDKSLPEATLAKLEGQVADLSKQVADELQELVAQQKRIDVVKANGTVGLSVESLTRVDDGVQELAAKVAEELDELREHQKELGKAKDSVKAFSKVEEDVREMWKEVTEELKQLRTHQQQLAQAKDVLMRDGLEAKARPEPAETKASPQLEAKVEELSREVVSELESLASHQNELKVTKANLHDLAKRMDDNTRIVGACEKATIDLKEEVENLKAWSLLQDSRKPSLEPLSFGKKEVVLESTKSKSPKSSKGSPEKAASEVDNNSREDQSQSRGGKNSPVRSGLGPLGRMGLPSQATSSASKVEEDRASEVSSYDNEAFDEADEDSMSAS